MTIAITPIHDRVVIKKAEKETATKSGIILSGTAAEEPNEGIVVAVGTGKQYDNGIVRPMSVSVGDRVIFNRYVGTDVTVDGEEVLVVKEEDVLCVIE